MPDDWMDEFVNIFKSHGFTMRERGRDARWLFRHYSFEDDLAEQFPLICDDLASEIYSSLTNTLWSKDDKHYSTTFRMAAGLIADLRDRGEDYLDFYCIAPPGNVSDRVYSAMSSKGWSYVH